MENSISLSYENIENVLQKVQNKKTLEGVEQVSKKFRVNVVPDTT